MAGLSFILDTRISKVPFLVHQCQQEHPGQEIPDEHIFTQPRPPGPNEHRRDRTTYYQYATGSSRSTARPRPSTGSWRPTSEPWPGSRGYTTNLDATTGTAQFVIDDYHRLFQIERSFRMPKHDLQARLKPSDSKHVPKTKLPGGEIPQRLRSSDRILPCSFMTDHSR